MQRERRRIVSWTPEEDDTLREEIRILGNENWADISAKFKDKTPRQCRRRWYTYLNSDFKKGGWSTEEDLLLCEAQKIFGNRWTEISKVVPGRTDNAVKNRFTTLCKKWAKYEASAEKERKTTTTPFINLNNKRIICNRLNPTLSIPETDAFSNKRRYCLGVHSSMTWDKREGITEAQSTPVFGLQATEVSSPKFSESVRHPILQSPLDQDLLSPRKNENEPHLDAKTEIGLF